MDTPFLWEEPRRKPWERLPDEPDKAFNAFTLFRDGGHSRNLKEAYRKYSGKEDASQVPRYFAR